MLEGTTDFNIGESSGEISVAKGLAFKTKSEYDLSVTAKDAGGRYATQTVKITLLAGNFIFF